MTTTYNDFINVYPVSKTLRFRLIPVGLTEEKIKENNVLESDILRSENYKKAKKLIDIHHSEFINGVLGDLEFNWEKLDALLKEKSVNKTELLNEEKNLLTEISTSFTENAKYESMFNKQLFSDLEKKYENDPENRKIIESFRGFTSYFVGFNNNRENFYKNDNKASSIGHRIVVENFRRHSSNIRKFAEIVDLIPSLSKNIENNFKKKYGQIDLGSLFTPNGFNYALDQKGIERYNTILGGFSLDGISKVKGINEMVNEYCQQNYEPESKRKALLLSPLYNQILSDKESSSFIYDVLESDEDVYNVLGECIVSFREDEGKIRELTNTIIERKNVIVDQEEIRRISHYIFGDYARLETLAAIDIRNGLPVEEVLAIIEKNAGETDCYSKPEDIYKDLLYKLETLSDDSMKFNLDNSKPLIQQGEKIQNIKDYLDSLLSVTKTLRHYDFSGDDYLSTIADEVSKLDEEVNAIYNKIRNYVTKKPYSDEKIKLNFNIIQLASGWSLSKEKECRSTILLKDGKYYLGIYNTSKVIDPEGSPGEDCYRKMKYEYIQDNSRMFPKCCLALKEVKDHFRNSDDDYVLDDRKFDEPFTVTKELWDIYDKKTMKKDYVRNGGSEKVYRDSLNTWISKCVEFFGKYKAWKCFDISSLKKPDEYTDLNDFYFDLNNCTYQISYVDVSSEKIDKMIENNELYLFQIYSKDFAQKATGKKDLNTMYFEALFSDYNLRSKIYQLNGGAELFWRKASLEKRVTHRKGSVLVNRMTKDCQTIPQKIYEELYDHFNKGTGLSFEAESYLDRVVTKKASHDIRKDKRYQEDQFFFHVPIKINYRCHEIRKFKDKVNNYLCNNPDIRIIGVDRGERNLIYVNMIDQQGTILYHRSFNIMQEVRYTGEVRDINYLEKLERREIERDEARKNWKSIQNIKELKEGYLSAAVHEITKLMVENRAILVLENLNAGFKRGRMKFERQVYQKFEMMLINKLNLLAFKDRKVNEAGSIYHGYQLTDPISTYGEIYQQTGFVFYTNAAYTSKIDPITGFADVFDHNALKESIKIEGDNNFIRLFGKIQYDKEKDMFCFETDLENFACREKFHKTKWHIHTNGDRISYSFNNGRGIRNRINLTERMKEVLFEHGINYLEFDNLIEPIACIEDTKERRKLAEDIYYIFRLAIQLRNSDVKTGEDYIISPIANDSGSFFDSRNIDENKPYDADDNGAFNIARKGLLILNRINESYGISPNLMIKNEEWFNFVQR